MIYACLSAQSLLVTCRALIIALGNFTLLEQGVGSPLRQTPIGEGPLLCSKDALYPTLLLLQGDEWLSRDPVILVGL